MSDELPEKLDIVIVSKDVAYWQKALDETTETIRKFESALRFESAVKEMIETKLAEAKALDK